MYVYWNITPLPYNHLYEVMVMTDRIDDSEDLPLLKTLLIDPMVVLPHLCHIMWFGYDIFT